MVYYEKDHSEGRRAHEISEAPLCAACACAAARAGANGWGRGDLFFVAVNDTIPVTLTSLPYTSGGVVYVPYTAFDARPGGVVSAYNATAQTFVLFTKDSRLVFDLATGETSDENQNTSTQTALFRNGLLYIPLIFCASHFGLKVSMLEKSGRLSCPALYHRQRGLRRFALYREG